MKINHFVSDIDGVLAANEKIPEELFTLLKEIQKYVPVSIATGRSLEGVKRIGLFDVIKNGFLILENGSLIYANGQILLDWEEVISGEINSLWQLKKTLSQKYQIIERERSFTIVDFSDFDLIEEFKDVQALLNFESCDFVSSFAGKEAAIAFLEKKGLIKGPIACVGNGDNDLGMLNYVQYPYTVSDASQNVLRSLENGGYISQLPSTDGGKDVLLHILRLVKR